MLHPEYYAILHLGDLQPGMWTSEAKYAISKSQATMLHIVYRLDIILDAPKLSKYSCCQIAR